MEGLVRSLRIFKGLEPHPKFTVKPAQYTMTVEQPVRSFFLCHGVVFGFFGLI